VKELDTMAVSKVGQGTLPKWWRKASGLSQGGVVEVRPVRDGRNSILLTPKPARRRGVSGKELLEQFSLCPHPMPAAKRNELPFK
jgi:bifunctional DNA-binding transcriptional regulator/antitoxin component of YhaV-PrlF toxin-antitoxin module